MANIRGESVKLHRDEYRRLLATIDTLKHELRRARRDAQHERRTVALVPAQEARPC